MASSSRSRASEHADEAFRTSLEREAPPLAVIERVTAVPVPTTGAGGFEIVPSEPGEVFGEVPIP
jgi:hydrogenase maturation factor HypF (carbamoyltransferase family)